MPIGNPPTVQELLAAAAAAQNAQNNHHVAEFPHFFAMPMPGPTVAAPPPQTDPPKNQFEHHGWNEGGHTELRGIGQEPQPLILGYGKAGQTFMSFFGFTQETCPMVVPGAGWPFEASTDLPHIMSVGLGEMDDIFKGHLTSFKKAGSKAILIKGDATPYLQVPRTLGPTTYTVKYDAETMTELPTDSIYALVGPSGALFGMWFGQYRTLYLAGIRGISTNDAKICNSTEHFMAAKKDITRLLRLFPSDRQIQSQYKEKAASVKPVIGCDIEFSIHDCDKLFHSATEFVSDSTKAKIGTDGNVETLEIRPNAASNPRDLTDNIEEQLSNLNEILPSGYDLHGGGSGDLERSTGFHIHFSNTLADHNNGTCSPADYCIWLDELLGRPIGKMAGSKRSSTEYGKLSDFRCRGNHGSFPHSGWEYRTLPTISIDRDFTYAVLHIAYCAVVTAQSGATVKLVGPFSSKWYESLLGIDMEVVNRFVVRVKAKENLAVPVLNRWFEKPFKKDAECDVEVRFTNHDYLNIANFVTYNPQKRFSRVVIYVCDGDDGRKQFVKLSAKCMRLTRYLLEEREEVAVTFGNPSASTILKYGSKQGETLFVGLSAFLARRLYEQSAHSRNHVKMFTQSLIKNM